jgi:hypothetical protein
MKKITLLSIAFILSFSLFSQTGNNCSSAINISLSTSSSTCLSNQVSQNSSNIWYKFTAIRSVTNFVVNYDPAQAGSIANAHVYTGACNSLVELGAMVDAHTDSLKIFINILSAGQTYYIRLDKNAGVGATSFTICSTPAEQLPWQVIGQDVQFDGKIGIGKTPTAPLDVLGNANVSGSLTAGNAIFSNLAGNGNQLLQTDATGNVLAFPMGNSSQILFGDGTWGSLPSNSQQLWQHVQNGIVPVSPNFSVGIGNNHPLYNLDVTGNAHISNNLTVNGAIIITDNIHAEKFLKTDTIHSITGITHFTEPIIVPSFSVTGSINIGEYVNVTKGVNATNLNVTGSSNFSDVNISSSVSSPRLVTTRIVAADTNGIHFGDSSLVIAPTQYGNNPVTSATGIAFEKIWVNTSFTNFAIGGGGNIATGINSMAIGMSGALAYGKNCMAIGMGPTRADGDNSLAIGNNVRTVQAANHSIVLGCGIPSGQLVNTTPYSLVVGFSNVPTLFVGGGTGAAGQVSRVGINTITPAAMLDIKIFGTTAGFNISNSASSGPLSVFNVANDGSTIINSTGSSPFTIKNSSLSVSSGASYARTLFEVTANGQTFIGSKSGTGQQRNNSGTTPPPHTTAMLHVNGDVVVGQTGSGAQANIWVTETGWADFVFDKNYKLMSLNELEIFYKENHHLPNVPTQTDIQENGNNLGQTDVVLLQKIEELTLYMVEQQKQLDIQKKRIEELTKIVEEKK